MSTRMPTRHAKVRAPRREPRVSRQLNRNRGKLLQEHGPCADVSHQEKHFRFLLVRAVLAINKIPVRGENDKRAKETLRGSSQKKGGAAAQTAVVGDPGLTGGVAAKHVRSTRVETEAVHFRKISTNGRNSTRDGLAARFGVFDGTTPAPTESGGRGNTKTQNGPPAIAVADGPVCNPREALIESRIISCQSRQREDCFQKAVIKRGLRRMRRSVLRARSSSSQ